MGTDNFGEKVAQTKISKTTKSRSRRERRIASVVMSGFNKGYCHECGFRIRGENHLTGSHHLGTRIDHKRKS